MQNKPSAELINEIVGSLSGDAPEWHFGFHSARRTNGTEIWLSNRYYATKMTLRGGLQFGGHTWPLAGILHGRWRKQIVDAALAAKDRRAYSLLNDPETPMEQYVRDEHVRLRKLQLDFAVFKERQKQKAQAAEFAEFMESRGGTQGDK